MIVGLGEVIKQLEEIKSKASLTEYEKARIPLEKEVSELQQKIYNLEKLLSAYNGALKYIIESIDGETIGVIVRTDNKMEVKTFNKKNQDLYISTKAPFEIVKVPIKQELRKDISKKINECLEQYNYYERSNIL